MTLTFVHTAEVHVATFAGLAAAVAPEIPLRHVVAAHLLDQAKREGGVSDELRERACGELLIAARGSLVVSCTCSTIGPCADLAAERSGLSILRVDRAMAEAAVERGPRVLVVACLETTLAPTRELVAAAASSKRRAVEIELLSLPHLWPKFEHGDRAGYLADIAAAVVAAASRADVVVLAQASMAGAVELCGAAGIPVLASPRLGVEAAVAKYRELLVKREIKA